MPDFQWHESDSGCDRCLPRDIVTIDARPQLGRAMILLPPDYFLLLV